MKKSVLVLMVTLMSLVSFGQLDSLSPYHNMQINEKIHFQGDSATSCFVVIQDLTINSLSSLKAIYMVRVYKSKNIALENNSWYLPVAEISNVVSVQFDASFTQGDLFMKVSESLKGALLAINPTWKASNIIIEP